MKEGKVSFLSSPHPLLLLAPFFVGSSTLAPRSLLRNSKETLARQANVRLCREVLEFPSTALKHPTRPACNKAALSAFGR